MHKEFADMKIETSLSGRGLELEKAFGLVDKIKEIFSSPYDPEKNPKGLINMGVAENYVMLENNADYINKKLQLSSFDFSYGTGPWGGPRLLAAMTTFVNKRFHPHGEVKSEEICFANGVSSICEMLAHALFEPGDYLLLSSPIYQAFKADFGTRAKVDTLHVSFGDINAFDESCIPVYESAILNAQKEGKRIRAFMLCNPHNPLGKCYTKPAIIGLLRLCAKYRIHLLSDEIYALSVYEIPGDDHAVPFTSILSLDLDKYIDKDYVHHLYGFSKDFAAGGIRMGSLITRNAGLRKAIGAQGFFSWSGNLSEKVATLMLEDQHELDKFLDLSKKRLASNNILARQHLDKYGIPYTKGANAGFFLWIDLRKWLPDVEEGEKVEKKEEILMGELIKAGVYVTSGLEMSAEEPGFFRLIFSQDPDFVKEGIKRIAKTIGVK